MGIPQDTQIVIFQEDKLSRSPINKDFIYEGKNDYKDLIVEVEVLDDIQQFVTSVPNWIKDLLPVTKKVTEPIFDMGDHCKGCQYIEKCRFACSVVAKET